MNKIKNKIIISTQPEESFIEFSQPLESLGAQVINMPIISVKESIITNEEIKTLENINQFDWLVFTSKNGVIYFLKKIEALFNTNNLPENIKIAVIGKKTGAELLRQGIAADYISKSNLAETFTRELKDSVINKGSNVLLLLGNLAGDTIETELKGYANVTRINCYETCKPQNIDKSSIDRINNGNYDIIIFTSSSGFHNFAEVLRINEINLSNLKVGSIGKSTTKTIEEYGIKPLFTAQQSNIDGLISETIKYFK